MSAYIVDRNHVLYLVEAAMSHRLNPYGGNFRWYWNDGNGELGCADYDRAAEVANMLWRENIKSVSTRYPNESSATLPGTVDAKLIDERDFNGVRWFDFEPVQVIKACDCFDYQSCEHGDEWQTSEAKSFIDSLRSHAWHALAAYDKAEWGAPPVYANGANVVKLSELR